MNNIYNKAISFIENNKITLSILIVFTAFNELILNIFNKTIKNQILINITQSYLLDLICIISTVIIILFTIVKFRHNYYISNSQQIKLLIAFILFFYIRYTYKIQLIPLKTIDYIYYFDIICIIILSPITLYFSRYKTNEYSNNNKRQITDSPIDDYKYDKLNLKNNINKTIEKINKYQSNESIAIGVVGEWGLGKTSYINLLKDELKKHNNNIVIDFNPWINIDSEMITQIFFNTIKNEMSRYSLSISQDLKKYSKTLSKYDSTDILEKLFESIFNDQGINNFEQFEKINEALKILNKKVIVFIDDTDRLLPDEIFNILKLIRNTAKFHNFHYIVTYDKDYIIESLESLKIPNTKTYIEKIFTEEIILLPYDTHNILRDTLLEEYPNKKDIIEEIFEINFLFRSLNFKYIFKHFRNIKKFTISFNTNYNSIADFVDFKDYFLLQILKFHFYDIYTLIFSKNYLKEYNDEFSEVKNTIHLLTLKPSDNTISKNVSFKDSLIKKIISDSYNDENIINQIGIIIDSLFSYNHLNHPTNKLNRSHNFMTYFKNELDNNKISDKEFEILINSPLDKVQDILTYLKINNKIDSLTFYLNIYLFDNKLIKIAKKETYENVISICFEIGRMTNNLDIKLLFDRTINNLDNISKYFYQDNTNNAQRFLLKQLSNYNSFNINFCLIANDSIQNPAIKDKLRSITLNYFKKYCELNNSYDNEFWNLFHLCKFKEFRSIGNNRYDEIYEYHPKVIAIFKNYIKKDLDLFLLNMLNIDKGFNNNVTIHELIKVIFGSFLTFRSILENPKYYNSLKKPSILREEFLKLMIQIGNLDKEKKAINIEDFESSYRLLFRKSSSDV